MVAFKITDYTLQWVWVGLMVICALIFIVRYARRIYRNTRKGANPSCNGCVLIDKCERNKSAEKPCDDYRGCCDNEC